MEEIMRGRVSTLSRVRLELSSTRRRISSMAEFLTKSPYSPPSWASHLRPLPSHTFSLAQLPTPIHRWNLPGLPNGTELWIKRDDFTGMELSGNKVRKLEFLMAEADEQNADTIITIGGIQSNHCRATSVASNCLNLNTHLILRTSKLLADEDPGLVGNLLVERLVGANVHLISKEEYSSIGSVALTSALKEKLEKEGRSLMNLRFSEGRVTFLEAMADKYNVEEAEALAKRALARYWKQYVEAQMAVNNDDATKQIFSRCLLTCLQVPLWFLPFGVGRRACPGAGFGMRVVALAVRALVQCFEWKKMGEEDIDMRPVFGDG